LAMSETQIFRERSFKEIYQEEKKTKENVIEQHYRVKRNDSERVLRRTTVNRCEWKRTIHDADNPRIEDD